MSRNLWIAVAFAIVLIGPLALRPKEGQSENDALQLVIISPHNEAIRYEFSRAFDAYYFQKHGKHVHVDWRTPGGTSEIARYLASEYLSAFENYWKNSLHREWNGRVQTAFDNPKAPLDGSPEGEARREFLKSDVGCGIDLFFGGGSFDLGQQASAGRLVDCGVVAAHPELFNASVIPENFGGEQLWDKQGRWIGACLSAYGICYNNDCLRMLHIENAPRQWSDLADTRYFGEVALANPTQSGSIAKAFEMLIQGMILELKILKFEEKAVVDAQGNSRDTSEITFQFQKSGETEMIPASEIMPSQKPDPHKPFHLDSDPKMMQALIVHEGWKKAMQLLQKISANARYFTDSATKVPFDVEAGDAAAGMCIDFYGRFQSEAARKPDGTSRMSYVTAEDGSSVGADPIGLLRGAPHGALAREFIEFAISPEGQKLWNWKVGTPGGPVKYALRRLPILPALYAPEYKALRSDPEENPYAQAGGFVYHPEWTAALFRPISFIVRVMCIDPHDEMRDAWQALIAANFPPQATAAFFDVSKVDYDAASGPVRQALKNPLDEIQLAKTLGESFRAQYRRAAELAREGK